MPDHACPKDSVENSRSNEISGNRYEQRLIDPWPPTTRVASAKNARDRTLTQNRKGSDYRPSAMSERAVAIDRSDMTTRDRCSQLSNTRCVGQQPGLRRLWPYTEQCDSSDISTARDPATLLRAMLHVAPLSWSLSHDRFSVNTLAYALQVNWATAAQECVEFACSRIFSRRAAKFL